MHVIISAILFC